MFELGIFGELSESFQQLEKVSEARIVETKERWEENREDWETQRESVPENARFPDVQDEELEYDAACDQLRVLRWGMYLAAYSYFERLVLNLVREHDPDFNVREPSTRDALRALKPTLGQCVTDWDNMYQRISELRFLRNELAHGAGFCRPESEKELSNLIKRNEISYSEGSFLIMDRERVLTLENGFLEAAIRDFGDTCRTLKRAQHWLEQRQVAGA